MTPKKSPPPAPAGPRPPTADLEVLKQLLALLDASSATTLKLQRGEVSYEVSRLGAIPAAVFGPQPSGTAPMHHAGGGPAPAASAPPVPASTLIEIKSPMVGTFYRAPEPGAEPYVKVGNHVAPGQSLCIIEAMKIMNELESEVAGMVKEILVEDAQPVEFGQVLFRVEPNV